MFEEALDRLASGALWGLGVGIVLTVARGGGPTLRWMTKGLIKTYVAIADSIQDAADEVRAERGAERTAAAPAAPAETG